MPEAPLAPEDAVARPSAAWWGLRAVPLVIAVLVFVFGVPRLDEVFRDFGVVLPGATRVVLSARRGAFDWTAGASGDRSGFLGAKLVVKGVVALAGVVGAAVFAAGRRRWRGAALLWLGVVLLVFEVVALAVPLLSMWTSLQRGA